MPRGSRGGVDKGIILNLVDQLFPCWYRIDGWGAFDGVIAETAAGGERERERERERVTDYN